MTTTPPSRRSSAISHARVGTSGESSHRSMRIPRPASPSWFRHPDHVALVAYAEGVLLTRARGAIDEHLRWCVTCQEAMHDIETIVSAPVFDDVQRFALDLALVYRTEASVALETGDLQVIVSRAFRQTLAFAVRWRGRAAAGAQVALELLHADGRRTDWSWTDTDERGDAVLVPPNERHLEPGACIELCVAATAQPASARSALLPTAHL